MEEEKDDEQIPQPQFHTGLDAHFMSVPTDSSKDDGLTSCRQDKSAAEDDDLSFGEEVEGDVGQWGGIADHLVHWLNTSDYSELCKSFSRMFAYVRGCIHSCFVSLCEGAKGRVHKSFQHDSEDVVEDIVVVFSADHLRMCSLFV